MRLSEDQVKQGILHDDLQVRFAALNYFAQAFSRDTAVMPIAIAALERFGFTNAFLFTSPIAELAQTPETIEWAIAELRRNGEENEADRGFRHSLARLLCNADPELTLPREQEIASLPDFNDERRREFAWRLNSHRMDDDACWREMEAICEAGKDKIYVNETRFDEAQQIAQSLARRGTHQADRMMTLLAEEIEDFENNPMAWLEPLMVYLAGEMRYEPAVPLIIGKLHEDGEILNEECQYALTKIGTDCVIHALGDAFPKAEWHFRLYASGVLGRVHSDLAVETGCRLLRTENDTDIRTCLATSLTDQFSSEANELAREVLLETPPWSGDLKIGLVVSCTLLGQSFPELERWRRDVQRSHERMSNWSKPDSTPAVSLSDANPVRRIDAGGVVSAPGRSSKPPGRNDPCPCGSGKKYKACCMRKAPAL